MLLGIKTGSLLPLLLVRIVMDSVAAMSLERMVLLKSAGSVPVPVEDLGVPCRPEPKMSGSGQCLSTHSLHCLCAMALQSIIYKKRGELES